MFVVWLLWHNSKNTYAHKLALYPRVCSLCNIPIDPFEESLRQRAIDTWVNKHGFCFRRKWMVRLKIEKNENVVNYVTILLVSLVVIIVIVILFT